MGNNRDQSQESEIAQVIEKIVASLGGDELLADIHTKLSQGDRDFLWAYLAHIGTQELASGQAIELQSAHHHHLAIIMEKLGIKSRSEFLRRVFLAFLAKLKKS